MEEAEQRVRIKMVEIAKKIPRVMEALCMGAGVPYYGKPEDLLEMPQADLILVCEAYRLSGRSSVDEVKSLEQWALETAEALFPSLEGFDRVKLAIGLIQARATECLHYSGKFSVGNYLAAVVADGRRLGLPVEAAFALAFSDRHAALERFGEAWARRYMAEQEERVIN